MIQILIDFIANLSTRFIDLTLAPFYYRDTLWMVVPTLFTLLFIELYFGRYKGEELGWSSAFGNSLVLIFVSIDLIRLLYNQSGVMAFLYINPKMALIIAVVLEGIMLTTMTFLHALPKGIIFNFSSALPMNFIAYISILLVYTDIPIVDIYTILSAFGLMAILVLLLTVIKLIEPKSYDIQGFEDKFKRAPAPRS